MMRDHETLTSELITYPGSFAPRRNQEQGHAAQHSAGIAPQVRITGRPARHLLYPSPKIKFHGYWHILSELRPKQQEGIDGINDQTSVFTVVSEKDNMKL